MTPAGPSSKSDLASPPRFLHGSTTDDDGLPPEPLTGDQGPETVEPDPTSPGAASPSTSSSAPTTPRDTARPENPSPPSSTTSSSDVGRTIGAEAVEVVSKVTMPAVLSLGIGANRLYRSRTGIGDRRWLLTEAEASDLAGAFSRILTRRVPEELIEGENGDLLTIVGTTAGYLIRNVLNLTEEQMTDARAQAADAMDDRRGAHVFHEPADVDDEPDQANDGGSPNASGVVLSAADVGAV